MKSTILLATALFLISAPAPDARDIAELSSNFIVPGEIPGLLADEDLTQRHHNSVSGGNTETSSEALKTTETKPAISTRTQSRLITAKTS